MDRPAQSPRPRHTTVAAGLIIGGSALAVLGVVDQLGALHSLETRQALTEFLRRPPGSDLGLDLTSARTALRTVLMGVAGGATAALVLGFGVLRRDHRARLALTLLAAPLFLAGLVTGGLWTSVVASASVFLWLGPSGDWFAGRTPERRPEPEPAPPPARERPELPPVRPSVPPTAAWYQPPAHPQVQIHAGTQSRPAAVLAACVMTWSLSGLAIGLMALTVGTVTFAPDLFWREVLRQQPRLAEQGMTRGELLTTIQVLGGLMILWAVVAIVLAALVFRGSNGARLALAVSGYGAAAFCLVGTLSSPLLVVPLLVCAAGASLLLRPESRAWCRPAPGAART